tara:strand:- start:17 stop:238 length:222 start_codon:yes stop_codon:yes gene_type:complete
MATNVVVRLRRGEAPERMIKRFIKKCKKEKVIESYRARTAYHIKPSVKKKMKRKKAIREKQKLDRAALRKMFR